MHIQKGMRMHTTRHSDRKHVAGICGACSRMSGSSTGAAIISGTGHTYHRSAYTATSSSSCTFFSEKINAAQARASLTTRLRLRGGCSGVCPRVLLTRQARNKEQTPPSRWTPFTVTAPDSSGPSGAETTLEVNASWPNILSASVADRCRIIVRSGVQAVRGIYCVSIVRAIGYLGFSSASVCHTVSAAFLLLCAERTSCTSLLYHHLPQCPPAVVVRLQSSA